MTALDFTDPAQVRAEAERRRERRAQGLPLTDRSDVVATEPPSERVWPMAVVRPTGETYLLPRPRSTKRETPEQAKVIKTFQRFGVRHWKSTSQSRRSKVGLGLPDIWVFGPTGRYRAWWWETKSGEDWRFSAAQLEFAEDCADTGTLYGCGDRFAAEVFCRALGLREL